MYLPDGTPYRATVSAIYSRSLASGDLLIPASVAAGHTGTPPGYSQILVSGGTPAELARLAAGHPGLHVTSRSVANAQSAQAAAQNSFANNLILGVLAVLSAVALLNTLVVMTVERRRVLRLLGRVGATRSQVAAVFGWQAVFVAGTGLVAGAAAGTFTLLTVTRAITGSWTPVHPAGSRHRPSRGGGRAPRRRDHDPVRRDVAPRADPRLRVTNAGVRWQGRQRRPVRA